MAYIGNIPAEKYSAFQKQDFTTSATTTYTLDNPVANANELALFINFVRQEPTTAYSASGTTLTLTEATSSSDDMYCVYLGKAVQTVTPANNSVTNAMLGETITVAKGGTGLTSGFKNGITMADQWRVNTVFTADSTITTISSNLEQIDSSGQGTIGTAMSESSGIFTFPSTGIYIVRATLSAYRSADARYVNLYIQATTNNSSYATIAQSYDSIEQAESSSTYANLTTESLIDVTDTSNVKVRFQLRATQVVNIKASTDNNENSFTFIRLGDT